MIPAMDPQLKQSAIETICAVTDPFCWKAKGSRWPDGDGMGAIAAQVRGHQSIPTLANGGTLVVSTASFEVGVLYTASYAGGNYTMNSSYSAFPGASSFTGQAITYRIVTAGIIIRNMAPALTTSGYVIITRNTNAYSGSGVVPTGNVYGTESTTHAICAGMEVPVIFRPLGSSARAFVPVNSGAPDLKWDVITVEIVGAPASTTVLDLEFVLNIEYTQSNNNLFLQQLVPVAAPSNPFVREISEKVSVSLGDLAATSVKGFGTMALRSIASRLYGAGPSGIAAGLATRTAMAALMD